MPVDQSDAPEGVGVPNRAFPEPPGFSPHNDRVPGAYLLDLDGTLIDSEPWYKQTEVEALKSFGVPMTLEHMEHYTGLTLPVWLDRVDQEFGKRIPIDDFLASYRPEMEGHVRENIQMFPDAREFLAAIDGSPAVLVTSSMKWYVDLVLERFPQIAGSVRAVVCEADVKIGKPDPEPYLLAAGLLQRSPAECMVVEDAINGVKSGLAAGCHVVAIDRHDNPSLAIATRVVKSLTELVAVAPKLP